MRLNRCKTPVHRSYTPFVKDFLKRSCEQKLSYYITSFKEVEIMLAESAGKYLSHGSVPPFREFYMPAISSFCCPFLILCILFWDTGFRNMNVCQNQTFSPFLAELNHYSLGLQISLCCAESPFTYLRPAKPPAAVIRDFPWGSPPFRPFASDEGVLQFVNISSNLP